MYRSSKRLRPLDPSSSDSEESDSIDEVDIADEELENVGASVGGDNMVEEVEHTSSYIPIMEEHPIIDDEVAGPSRPGGSGNNDPLFFEPFSSFDSYNSALYSAPPPTPGGGYRSSPQPSSNRESPQPGPSSAITQPQPGPSRTSPRKSAESSTRVSTRSALAIAKGSRPLTGPLRPIKGGARGGVVATPAASGGFGRSTLRRTYGDLIETCQGYEEKEGLESDLQQIMTESITEGKGLFEELKRLKGGPGDMYMAFLHTRMCSQVIRFKSYTIGSATSGFKLDVFLKALSAESRTSLNEYSPRLLTRRVSERAADCCKTLPHLSCMIGAFDRDKMSVQKEKKQRAPPRKRVFEQNQTLATQHEEINISQRNEKEPTKNPETLTQEIFKILKKHKTGSSTNLFEFALDKNSFANSIEYLFYVGFLIKDGFVALSRGEPTENEKPGDSCLVIKPEKPPQKSLLRGDDGVTGGDGGCRNQYILSFTPKLWKSMSSVALGEDIITKYKSADPP